MIRAPSRKYLLAPGACARIVEGKTDKIQQSCLTLLPLEALPPSQHQGFTELKEDDTS